MNRGGFFLTLAFTGTTFAQSTIVLDGSGTGKIFQGIGGVSAGASSRLLIDYPEPARSQILDYLFRPNYGASLHHLKVEIGGDVNSTDGSEPSHMHSRTDENYTRGYEWWLIQQAKLRNPNITIEALEWGAPGWIGNGNFFSQDNIDYIIKFIRGAKSTYGIDIDYVGIWNETDFNAGWIVNLKAALIQAGLPTKIVAADQPAANTAILDQMVSYPALMAAVDVVGVHYPNGGGPYSQKLAGQPAWASEEGPWRGDWIGARYLAKMYNRNYVGGKFTLSEVWAPVTSYYDIFFLPGAGLMYANTPWSGYYDVQPAIWATAHTTQFVQPGWQYIDSSSGFWGAGSYATLRQGSDYSVIFETIDVNSAQTINFRITNGLSTGIVHVWKSDANSQFIQQSDIVPVNGTFSVSLDPGSIYSLTTRGGQSKGSAAPPSDTAFPLPYGDDFESYTVNKQAKYFSDVNGSFEIFPCVGGHTGQCLEQTANIAPIPWHLIGPIQPATILGAPGLQNYEVSCDVYFKNPGSVKLVGRVRGVEVNDGPLKGYQFYVSNTGDWSVRRGNFVYLAGGHVSFVPDTWHTLKLAFRGGTITATIDGVSVADVTDGTISAGLAGVGVEGWTNAQFDNFRLDFLPETGLIISQSQITASASTQAAGYDAGKAVDENSATYWMGNYTCQGGCITLAPLPQSITLALGGTYGVDKIRYLPRQDGNNSGTITGYNIYLSSDGVAFFKIANGIWANDTSEKVANFSRTLASYMKLEAVAAVSGFNSASEVHVGYSLATVDPAPGILGLSPSSKVFGGAAFLLSVAGTNFVDGASVLWNGQSRPTNFVNASLLTAQIPADDIAAVGSAQITVVNPTPGGGESSPAPFVIATDLPPVTNDPPPSASATAFVTGFSTSNRAVRNNYTGWVGAKFTAGANPLKVSSLGRACLAGNAGMHPAKLVNGATGQDVSGSLVSVYMANCIPGQFVYALLPATVSLTPNTTYYVVTSETTGADTWYDLGPVTTTTDASVISAVYSWNGSWIPNGGGNIAYVPVNFQYTALVEPPVAVTVQTDIPGTSVFVDGASYPSPKTFGWVPGTSHTIAINPQSWGAGVQYVWSAWSDSGGASHTVTASIASTFTATLKKQFQLTSSVTPSGSGTIERVPNADYYDLGTPVQATAKPADGATFLNWSADASGSEPIQSLTMAGPLSITATFQPPPAPVAPPLPTGTPLFTAYSTANRPLRNNYAGWVGTKFTVGKNSLNVASLGRVCVAGNNLTHSVKFVNASTGLDIPGGAVQLNMNGCVTGQFAYAPFASNIALAANATYYLVSLETNGGDKWYDLGPVTPSSDVTVTSSIYSFNSAWLAAGTTNSSYVPVNFLYSSTAAPPITVTVQTDTPATTVAVDGVAYDSPKQLSWDAGSSHTIAIGAQSAGSGAQYVWSSWSDGGAVSHSVSPTTSTTFAAILKTQYQLLTTATPTGAGAIDISPTSPTGFYDTGTSIQLTARPLSGSTFLSWTGSLSGPTPIQIFSMTAPNTAGATFQPPPLGLGSPFVTGHTARPLRNDYSGWVGSKLTVGASALSVVALGRMCITGNANAHTVKLVNSATGQDEPGASVSVAMSGCTPGQFVYASLNLAVTLPAGRSYHLVSQEFVGGDKWNDLGPVTTTPHALINSAVYSLGANWITISSQNISYVPVGLKYSLAP